MDVAWYIVLSALIFCIGLTGVLTRRNPLVVLLSLELLLNAGNLALIAFSRMWGNADGQIFALIVMVVAACEVVVGLGLIVAMYRNGIPIDPLSVFMCLVVSGVSMLIHLYSVAYMDSDRGCTRFFAYLNYFVFSMLLLVLASNFVLLIVGWAFVGAASYLLISFWYRRETATRAGIKAFVMNVIGDVGLVIATFLLFDKTGDLSFAGVFAKAPQVFAHNDGVLVGACLMLLVAAFAES